MNINPFHSWLSKPEAQSVMLREAPREHFEQAREAVMAELEIATVDQNGKRLKEREVRTALKVVAKL
jgi:hypothetical protein